MSNSLMTPDSAPRDVAQLAGQGPFIHRRLGESLAALGFPCWQSDREKSAFVTASPQDRAQAILTSLQAYDHSKGGGGAPPPAQQQVAPPPAAQTPPPATQGAPAAASTGRQPKTNGAANGGGTGNVVELLNALKVL